jgi:hypothetical protein
VRTIKLFAVIGLAVALMGVWAMAQAQQIFPAPPDANDIEIVKEKAPFCVIAEAYWTKDGKRIGSIIPQPPLPPLRGAKFSSLDIGFRGRFGTIRIDGQTIQIVPIPPDANDIEIVLTGETEKDCLADVLYWTRDGSRLAPLLKSVRLTSIHVDNKDFKISITTVPTLTEWGLIALAVLLAGGMGYMIYRRRPALRPAAP